MKRLLFMACLIMSPVDALGQTVLDNPPVKPGGAQPAAPEAGADSGAEVPADPIEYPDLHQPGRISPETGLVQRAWDKAPDQAGVAEYRLCDGCVYRIRTRELMVTTIVIPEGLNIAHVDLGDTVGFEVQARGGNMLAIRPRAFGIDTNMNVYTDDGVLSFYLRAEGFDSGHVPDLLVRIGGNDNLTDTAGVGIGRRGRDEYVKGGGSIPPVSGVSTDAPSGATGGITGSVAGADPAGRSGNTEFDPARLRGWGRYTLRGNDALRPETVFRDDYFTYVHFGDRWIDLELPVAFVVIDGIDETVNTRVLGRTLVIESTAPSISLKSGESHLCIDYMGDGA